MVRSAASRSTAGPSEIPGMSPEHPLELSVLNAAAKSLLEEGVGVVWVRGEVSNFTAHRNGHWYFTLRSADAELRCVIWSSAARRLPTSPDNGMQVVARGSLTVWPAKGTMQFDISTLRADGEGLWRKAFEDTMRRLDADGLLAQERKRPLPVAPRVVAMITSADGAAWHDVVTVARRRSPGVHLVLVPARVQGEGAPESLIAAIERVSRWRGCDVLIIGRGGGSREDLWAFNDERVARALARAPMPTVSAVGHEVDIAITDFVADLRAATPSAAAEAVVPSVAAQRDVLRVLGQRLARTAQRRQQRAQLRVEGASHRLRMAVVRSAERRRHRLAAVAGRLEALSPLGVLARGYSVARTPEGATLSGCADFSEQQPFELWLRDGVVDAVVHRVRRREL